MTQDISCDWNFSYKLVTTVEAADSMGAAGPHEDFRYRVSWEDSALQNNRF